MKRTLEHSALQKLPFAIQEELLRAIDQGAIDLLFVTSLPYTPICKITVVLSKAVLPERKVAMQKALWIKEAYERFNIVVCICEHTVFPFKSDFHFTYIALNLHPRFVVYSRTEKVWQSLFQNYYLFSKRKQWLQTNRWLTEMEEKHAQHIVQYVLPLREENQFAAASILYKQMLRSYLLAIKNLLFPMNVGVIHTDRELLKVLKQYFPDLYAIFVNESRSEETIFLLLETTHIDTLESETYCQNLCDILAVIAGRFKKEVKSYFESNIETLLHDTDGELVFTKQAYEAVILNKIKGQLAKAYNLNLIYLIDSKDTDQGMAFMLLLVGVGITANKVNEIRMAIKNLFKQKIELTVLLHNTTWLKEHAHNFLPFVYKYITDTRLLYSKNQNTHLDFIYPVYEIANTTTDSHNGYWKLCKNNLESLWEQINHKDGKKYKLHTIAHLRSIFKQLCLAYLYKQMHYIPHIKSPKYLWSLVQWVDDDFSIKLLPSDYTNNFFNLLATRPPYFPTEQTLVQEPKQEDYKNALYVCSLFYNKLKELYI